MAANLQQYFPMIRNRVEMLSEIQENPNLSEIFDTWNEEQQKEFLDFCSGVRGVSILYDAFFKEIFNPESTPERLEELLSLILRKNVKIVMVLPNDSTRIADESSLLIMDIVVELDDGSIANVEVQRLGYAFPGARCACYSADLLLRQYKRVKSEKKKRFSYKDVQKVYTIVLFQKSTHEFHEFPNDYIHNFHQESDTGIKIDLLQEFVFLPLDIFRKYHHNKGINNKLEAWLTFLSIDSPDAIAELLERYPEYQKLYEEVYELCRNTEKVMHMFSKELQELDKNTVQYMIDDMQDKIDEQQETINKQDDTINEMQDSLNQKDLEIEELKKKLAQLT